MKSENRFAPHLNSDRERFITDIFATVAVRMVAGLMLINLCGR